MAIGIRNNEHCMQTIRKSPTDCCTLEIRSPQQLKRFVDRLVMIAYRTIYNGLEALYLIDMIYTIDSISFYISFLYPMDDVHYTLRLECSAI